MAKLTGLLSRFETAMLAVAPLFAYFLAYNFERGYLGEFGVPPEFITINTTTFLLFGSAVVALGLVAATSLSRLFDKDEVGTTPSERRSYLLKIVLDVLLWGGLAYLLKMGWFLPLSVLLLILLFRFPFWVNKRGRVDYFFVILLLVISTLSCGALGRWQASMKTEFVVLSSEPTTIVIRRYDDRMLCGSYDEKELRISPRFQLIPLGDQTIALEIRKIGQLQPAAKDGK